MLAAWFLAVLQATLPASRPEAGLRAFLARLHAALVAPDAPAAVHSFRAEALLTRRDPEGVVDVEAVIAYRAPDRIRTEIVEGDTRIVRAADRGRLWMRNRNEVYALEGKEYARDRAAVRRDLALAALLVRYLRPAEALAHLQDLRGPRRTVLRFGRLGRYEAFELRGTALDGRRHPLALTPGHKGPVAIRVWFAREDLRLLQVELRPLDAKTRRPAGPREVLRFHRHARLAGFVLPVAISVLHPDAAGRLRVRLRLSLRSFEPNVPLPAKLFQRPR